MILVLQGNDLLEKNNKKAELYAQYRTSVFDFIELTNDIEISSVVDALQSVPMEADNFFVSITLNKRQFIRLKGLFRTGGMTVLLLILEDFSLTEELQQGVEIDKVITCNQLSFKDNVRWIQQKAKGMGYSLDLEDRKQLALMFQTSKELNDVLFQMSMLPDFERSVFFSELFSTRQKFVWELFIELLQGNKKEFFTKYAVQYRQNIELSPSQFNMKLVGGLIYCLNSWKNAPSWIYEKIQDLEEREEVLVPYLYTWFVEILTLSRKVQSNIPVLELFMKVLGQIRKL